jgi:hypothetical protein
VDSHIPVLYLTIDGHEPSNFSTAHVGKDGYVCISFKNEILIWLEACMRKPETKAVVPVRENLKQLIAAVKSLCGKSEDAKMEDAIFKLVTQSDDSVRAALAVNKNVDFGKAAWEAFKGTIYETVLAAWPQGSVDCISEDGWDYLWLDFKDGKFGLSVNYLWNQVELRTEDGSDANSPEGKAFYEKMGAEFNRRPMPSQVNNVVWLSRDLWWPGFANDELYQFHLYKLYTERPQEVAERIVSIVRALESVKT